MLAYTSLRQSEPVADGAHGQGCTGHHTNGGVCQRLNPLCMQAFAEQSIDKPVCILKLGRPRANNHWYLPPPRDGQIPILSTSIQPSPAAHADLPHQSPGSASFRKDFLPLLILLLLKPPENEVMLKPLANNCANRLAYFIARQLCRRSHSRPQELRGLAVVTGRLGQGYRARR